MRSGSFVIIALGVAGPETGAVPTHEFPDKMRPVGVVVQLPQYREKSRQQVAQIVEEQLAVDRDAPVFDALWCRAVFRVADMGRQRVLPVLEAAFTH